MHLGNRSQLLSALGLSENIPEHNDIMDAMKDKSQQMVDNQVAKKLKMNYQNRIKDNILPMRCDVNKSSSNLSIDPSTDNLISYYRSCIYKPKHRPSSTNEFAAMYYGIISKELIYQHVFKAGGTTIIDGINNLYRDHKIKLTQTNFTKKGIELLNVFMLKQRSVKRIDIDANINKDALVFSFIRDPVSKVLSAFFEVNWRAYFPSHHDKYLDRRDDIIHSLGLSEWSDYAKIDGMDAFKMVIVKIYELKDKESVEVYLWDNYLDTHFVPKLLHLMPNGVQNNSLPYNFIGNLNNLGNDLPQLLDEYIIDKDLKNNADLLMDKYFPHQRNRMNTNDSIFNDDIDGQY